jgi:ArsR family transcriptional regulator
MMAYKNQAREFLFKILSNEVRLQLIEALHEGEKSVGELCNAIEEEQTRVSHELHCLMVCGFVNYRRDGKRIIYSLNGKTVIPLLESADRHIENFGERMKSCNTISDARRVIINELSI